MSEQHHLFSIKGLKKPRINRNIPDNEEIRLQLELWAQAHGHPRISYVMPDGTEREIAEGAGPWAIFLEQAGYSELLRADMGAGAYDRELHGKRCLLSHPDQGKGSKTQAALAVEQVTSFWELPEPIRDGIRRLASQIEEAAQLEQYANENNMLVCRGKAYSWLDYPCNCEVGDPEECQAIKNDQRGRGHIKAVCRCRCHLLYEPF